MPLSTAVLTSWAHSQRVLIILDRGALVECEGGGVEVFTWGKLRTTTTISAKLSRSGQVLSILLQANTLLAGLYCSTVTWLLNHLLHTVSVSLYEKMGR